MEPDSLESHKRALRICMSEILREVTEMPVLASPVAGCPPLSTGEPINMQATQNLLSAKASAVYGDRRSLRTRAAQAGRARRVASVKAVLSEDVQLAPELDPGFNPIDPNKTGRLVSARSLARTLWLSVGGGNDFQNKIDTKGHR